jgi:hypothetical protein
MKRLLLVALLLLGLGWATAPRAALPLYDGIGFPDQPYRFVHPPKGAPATKPPTTARSTTPVHGGRNGTLIAASAEVAPQVSVQIPPGRLAVPDGAARVRLTGRPGQPLRTASGQYLWSNVYDVSVTPRAGLRPSGLQATITLRAATAQRPIPKIAHYTAGHWALLPTFPQGRDIYVAELAQFGRYAVIGTVPIDVTQLPGYGSGSHGSTTGLLVGIGALVVVAGLFALGYLRRSRARAAVTVGADE